MCKREKKLWIMMFIIIMLIISVLYVLINYNDEKKYNNLKEIEDILIEEETWVCNKALRYTKDGRENKVAVGKIIYKFYEDSMEICSTTKCQNYNYSIENEILLIDGKYIDQEYSVKYENDVLLLEENNDNGTKVVYYFTVSME